MGFLLLASSVALPGAAVAQAGVVDGDGTQSRVVLPRPTGPARISGGVMAGLLLTKVDPVYPQDLKAAGVQGIIELHVIIGKDGSVEKVLWATPGPVQLHDAAIEAVRQWKYRPFLLNGEPVEVDTIVQVRFQIAAPAPGA